MCKVGDKVRVKRSYPNPKIVIGEIYTILGFNQFSHMLIGTRLLNGNPCDGWHAPQHPESYFELITEPIKPLTYKQLYAEAKVLGIKNRSLMNKEGLQRAIHLHKEGAEPPIGLQILGCNHFSYAYKYNDNKPVIQKNGWCYAPLRYTGPVSEIVFTVNTVHPYKEEYKSFIDFVLARSAWNDLFITKSFDEARKNGLYMNTNHSKNRVLTAAVSARIGSEFSNRPVVFKKIVDLGFKEPIAYLLASYVNNKNQYQAPGNGHDFFTIDMDKDHVFKFLKHGFHKGGNIPFKEVGPDGFAFFETVADNYPRPKNTIGNYLKNLLKKQEGEGFNVMILPLTDEDLKEKISIIQKEFDEHP